MKGLFITGNSTDVGKTFIAQQLIQLLNKTHIIRARKPMETDCQHIGGKLIPKDGQLLAQACVHTEPLDVVCPFRFSACASVEKASDKQGIRLTLKQLIAACQTPDKGDFVIVEGAGGLLSPIAPKLLNSDLALGLGLPLILVIKDELGALNQALLCLQAAKNQHLKVALLVFNQITPNALENTKAIKQYTNVPVVGFGKNNTQAFKRCVLSLI